ncbi:MAG: protein kinase [Myxococcota bacterium]
MICPECGAKNLPTAEECAGCGAVLPQDAVEDDPLIGRVVGGKYELEAIIGEGSMGCVYAARQRDLDKEVAIKVLHTHVAADPKVAKRFHREARTASRLSHPNSLEIFDFGREDEGPLLYIVMELLDGPDLLELLEDEFPLSPRRIGDLVGGVLRALEEAHHHGVIHRDLKPENIMVIEDRQGREHVKVCDFGIAKLVEAEGSAITVTGFVCGTPEYMAPEQARGENLDARADLYAIGCVLYHLLTNQVPFSAGSALGTITKHLTEAAVPPSRARPDLFIPRALDRVAMKALAKDPELRYESAQAMREALDAAVDALGPIGDDPLGTHSEDPTREASAGLPMRWLAPALVAGGMLLLAIVAYALNRSEAGPVDIADAGLDARVDRGSDAGASPDAASPDVGFDVGVDSAFDVGVDAAETMRASMASSVTVSPMTASMTSPMRTDDAPQQPPGQAAFEEGRRRFLANDIRGAIAAFEDAARRMPRNAQVQKQLGRAYMRTGNVAQGVRAYRRYLELAPNAGDRALVEQILERSE